MTSGRLRPHWRLRPPPPLDTVRELERALKLSPAFCRLLAVRNHDTPGGAKSFLRPLVADLHDPAELLGAEEAAGRLVRAVRSGEKVLVHGDYDVDGIAGAALLTEWLRAMGARADAFVPNRLRDGYDLGEAGVARATKLGATLLVTVDCGTTAVEWVRRAGAAGVDVVVTDHHRPGAVLPPALALVNPSQPGCAYPNKDLCGAAVAFKVAQLAARMLGRPADEAWERLDLVALATVADQVGVSGENRILVRYGLKAASRGDPSARPGLSALLARCGPAAQGRPLDSGTVAFQLAPRINAAGRIGDPEDGLRLLLTRDPNEAAALAAKLDAANEQRRSTERRIVEEATEALHGEYDPARDRAVVVAGDRWHPGVIGIVASRLAERLHRPVVVVALDGDRGRGSARSIPRFDVHDALGECREHMERFGGHPQAAGMDLRRAKVPALREAFLAAARKRLGDEEPRPVLNADIEVGLDEIDRDFHRYLHYFGPLGRGNPKPLFVARRVRLDGPPAVMGGRHLRFRMMQGRAGLAAFGPGLAEQHPAGTLETRPVDVAFSLTDNTYQGRTTVEARVRDIRPSQ